MRVEADVEFGGDTECFEVEDTVTVDCAVRCKAVTCEEAYRGCLVELAFAVDGFNECEREASKRAEQGDLRWLAWVDHLEWGFVARVGPIR